MDLSLDGVDSILYTSIYNYFDSFSLIRIVLKSSIFYVINEEKLSYEISPGFKINLYNNLLNKLDVIVFINTISNIEKDPISFNITFNS